MPSGRLVAIHRCHDCEHCGYLYAMNEYHCAKTARNRRLRNIETIPAWCPLPKAPKDEKKEAERG